MTDLQFESHRFIRGCISIGLLTLGFCFGPNRGDSYPVSRILSLNVGQSSPDKVAQLLKVKADILSQGYCKDTAKTFAVIFRIRINVTNQSDKKLIVERTTAQYGIVVAHDEKNLSEGKYEYSPSLYITTEPVSPETHEKFKSPGAEFAILAPGELFQTEAWIRAPLAGRQQGSDQIPDTIPPGDHVLQVRFSTWDFQTKPEEIRKQWQSFGHLVYESISTGPLAFNLPPDPRLDNCH
jgi:hypothetical protein